MFNREQGKTKQDNPMATMPSPVLINAIQHKTREVPTVQDKLISKLVSAYNSRAYANPYAPLLSKGNLNGYNAEGDRFEIDDLTAYNRGGDRLGFLQQEKNPEGITYRAGIDDERDLDREWSEKTIGTPFGDLAYGYEDGTNYAGFTPNAKTMAYIQAIANLLNKR